MNKLDYKKIAIVSIIPIIIIILLFIFIFKGGFNKVKGKNLECVRTNSYGLTIKLKAKFAKEYERDFKTTKINGKYSIRSISGKKLEDFKKQINYKGRPDFSKSDFYVLTVKDTYDVKKPSNILNAKSRDYLLAYTDKKNDKNDKSKFRLLITNKDSTTVCTYK